MDSPLRAARPAAAAQAATAAADSGPRRLGVAGCAACIGWRAPTHGGTTHLGRSGVVTGRVCSSGSSVSGAAGCCVAAGTFCGGSTGAHRGHPAAAALDGHPAAMLVGAAPRTACPAAAAADTTEAAVERDAKCGRPPRTTTPRCRPTHPLGSAPVDSAGGRYTPVAPRCPPPSSNGFEAAIHYDCEPRACCAWS